MRSYADFSPDQMKETRKQPILDVFKSRVLPGLGTEYICIYKNSIFLGNFSNSSIYQK